MYGQKVEYSQAHRERFREEAYLAALTGIADQCTIRQEIVERAKQIADLSVIEMFGPEENEKEIPDPTPIPDPDDADDEVII